MPKLLGKTDSTLSNKRYTDTLKAIIKVDLKALQDTAGLKRTWMSRPLTVLQKRELALLFQTALLIARRQDKIAKLS